MDKKHYESLIARVKGTLNYYRMIERLIATNDFCKVFEKMSLEEVEELKIRIFHDHHDRGKLEEYLIKFRKEGDEALFKMNVEELRSLASQLYIPYYYKMNKDTLIIEILTAKDELYGSK